MRRPPKFWGSHGPVELSSHLENRAIQKHRNAKKTTLAAFSLYLVVSSHLSRRPPTLSSALH